MFYPEFSFGPVNLWSLPKQKRDYEDMKFNAERRKANRMKLKPTKRPSAASQVVIEPARGVGASMQSEQIMDCIARRNGGRR